MCVRERDYVYMCVCVCERESMFVCERERLCIRVCEKGSMCVCERERERKYMCVLENDLTVEKCRNICNKIKLYVLCLCI